MDMKVLVEESSEAADFVRYRLWSITISAENSIEERIKRNGSV